VDESLEVGDAENARPVCLRPGQYIGYHLLDPDQRAAYVRWLARENIPAEAMRFCVRLHVAALEWFLFRDHVCPNLVIDELLRVIECTAESADAPLLRILAWTAFFQSRDVHIAVMEELVGSGCCLDGSMARLLLLDCADSNRRIWPELAFEIIALFGGIRDARGCEHFRERYISRFRILYPDGLGITAGRRRTQVEYNLYCYELRTETCRLVIQDALESVLPALREVAAPLIGEKRIDPQKPS
jgi:hypothetical protein